jgi:alpha-beta hydrolase superfamily lysophospholipase
MIGAIVLAFVALAAIAFAVLSLMPIETAAVERAASASVPARSYEEALAAFAEVQSAEAALPLDERCLSSLLAQPQRAARVVVFLHGLTNCPAQGDQLAAQLFARGYTVYVPRIPRHGFADRLTLELADLTAAELAVSATEALDLATGLGEEVVVVGISAGGNMTAWLAQTRSEVDRAIVIAPYLGPVGFPTFTARAIANGMALFPNLMIWWNPSDPLGPTEMDYAYPRFSTRAVGEVMRFGRIAADLASQSPPAAGSIAVMINEADEAASNPLTLALADAWRSRGAAVEVETLPGSLGLPHDVIDPRQPAQNIAHVYPILFEMIEGARPSGP